MIEKKKLASVLVTGGAGYIGSHTCKALAAAGYHPVSLDNLTLGHRWAIQWGPLVEADLLDAEAVQRALREHRIEAVIHFAASAYVGDSMRDPAAYYRNNVLTTLALLDAMRSADVKDIIFSSSCSVYGNPSRVPIDETHPTGPLSPYGQSKLDGENALRWYGQAYGMRWMALRYFNAAGADAEGQTGEDHNPETRLVPRAIMAALGSAPALEIFGTDYPTPRRHGHPRLYPRIRPGTRSRKRTWRSEWRDCFAGTQFRDRPRLQRSRGAYGSGNCPGP